jgi:hypothetical protein
MATTVWRFAQTSAAANRALLMPIATPKSFDTVAPQQRGFDTVLIRFGLLREETGESEKAKQLK